MRIIIAGIGTEVGKTVASAILVKLLNASYWKPIQAGGSDSEEIKKLCGNVTIYSEAYKFKNSCSPHVAAQLENVVIKPDHIIMPNSSQNLIIEMAGGVLSPLNDQMTQLDLFSSWDCHWILVSRHYLGSINHTLLSLAVLKQRRISLLGIIFNGHSSSSETFIKNYCNVPCLGELQNELVVNSYTIERYAKKWSCFWP